MNSHNARLVFNNSTACARALGRNDARVTYAAHGGSWPWRSSGWWRPRLRAQMSRPPSLSLSTGDGDFGRPMALEASSESLDLASSFTLSASGTFAKEDFVINKSGIAAINHTEVRRTGLQLQDLEFFEVLGKGASSLVRRAVHKPSQAQLAVKIINVFDKGKRDQLLRELRTLYSSQNYPWLVAFHDCLYDEGAMYIVLEYMDGGSLADVLQAAQLTGSSALSEPVLARLAARVLGGLNYLHVDRHQVRANLTHPPTCLPTYPPTCLPYLLTHLTYLPAHLPTGAPRRQAGQHPAQHGGRGQDLRLRSLRRARQHDGDVRHIHRHARLHVA